MHTSFFKHNLLFYNLTGKQRPTDAENFSRRFWDCMSCDQNDNKYFLEWREKLNKEMNVFNAKIALDKADDGSNSQTSGSTAIVGN